MIMLTGVGMITVVGIEWRVVACNLKILEQLSGCVLIF